MVGIGNLLISKTVDFMKFVLWVYPSDSMSTDNLLFKRMIDSEQVEEVQMHNCLHSSLKELITV